MRTLYLRNVPDDVVERLGRLARRAAARRARSAKSPAARTPKCSSVIETTLTAASTSPGGASAPMRTDVVLELLLGDRLRAPKGAGVLPRTGRTRPGPHAAARPHGGQGAPRSPRVCASLGSSSPASRLATAVRRCSSAAGQPSRCRREGDRAHTLRPGLRASTSSVIVSSGGTPTSARGPRRALSGQWSARPVSMLGATTPLLADPPLDGGTGWTRRDGSLGLYDQRLVGLCPQRRCRLDNPKVQLTELTSRCRNRR